MTEYVAGFMFDADRVALVVKNRPEWQKGKMNGIGGHIESGETPEQAMSREFVEETGYWEIVDWNKFAVLSGEHFRVHFFWSEGNHDILKSPTDEKIVSVAVRDVTVYNSIPNLPWLIPMARSIEFDSASSFDIQEVR